MEHERKINQLLKSLPKGIVLQSSWLKQLGYSPSLQQRYRNSGWLEAIGSGAMIRADDHVSYEGAIYALQRQSGLSAHPGGRTALTFLGKAHYLELSSNKAVIFGGKQEKLPVWFKNHQWNTEVNYYPTSFLPLDMGLTEVEVKDFSIKVSSAARALLECLYLAPAKQELSECYELMEGLNNLRPDQVQSLLESCQSIKVKRLFVYMAEKIGHAWFAHLNLKNIDLGRGKRSIVKDGIYIPKYQITIPSELETEHGQRNL